MHLPHLADLYHDRRIDHLRVCHLDRTLADQLKCPRLGVLLSHESMKKQRLKHPEITLEKYEALPLTILCGEYWRDCENGAVIVYVDSYRFNTTFRAYIKGTPDGLFVISFNLMRDRFARKERRKQTVLLREHL